MIWLATNLLAHDIACGRMVAPFFERLILKNNWLMLAVTLAIQAMVSMALLTLPVMAPVVAGTLGVSSVYVGVYVAIVYVGAILASLAAGTAVARYGAIRVSQAGLLICALGLALCTVNSVPVIALGALLIGIGYGPVTPVSYTHLRAHETDSYLVCRLLLEKKKTRDSSPRLDR